MCCYSKEKRPTQTLQEDDFRTAMLEMTKQFTDDIIQKGDSIPLKDINNSASQYKNKIKNHMMDAIDIQFQKQNQGYTGNSLSKDLNLEKELREDDNEVSNSSCDEPLTGVAIQEEAKSVWKSMLESVKSWFQRLLDFLKKIAADMKRILNSTIDFLKDVFNWFMSLF